MPESHPDDPSLTFFCTQCGACCRRAYRIGMPLRKDVSTCIYLGSDNRCTIYDHRPEICKVDYQLTKKKMTRLELYRAISKKCNEMIREDGMDEKYLIDIDAVYGPDET